MLAARATQRRMCYKQIGWIDTWLNDPKVKAELGVNPDLKFESCNMSINQVFMIEGDVMKNTIVYAGNAGKWPSIAVSDHHSNCSTS
jgi:hypothetical protein